MTETLSLPPTFASSVCRWFSENGRSLPWRGGGDPYRVWLSEIMLQQTRIETVIPYYERFLAAFPDIPSLAAADDDHLLKLWEGLGYYSRVRNLKKAALILVRDYGGALPPDYDLLRKLPGIGDYTAGAVASVAFGLPEAAVDGNVLRVVSRVAGYEGDVTKPETKKAVTEALRPIYPGGRDAAHLTEGLMELGEVLCVPGGNPACGRCPLASICIAHAEGRAAELPVRSPKKERRVEERLVLLIRREDGAVILQKRPAGGLLPGLWEFPNTACEGGESPDPFIIMDKFLASPKPERADFALHALGEAKHVFTHVEWRMIGVEVRCPKDAAFDMPGSAVFAMPEEVRGIYAVPSAFRAWVKKLG